MDRNEGIMSCPTISIKFIGTSCNCCSGNSTKNECKVAYRADEDCFIAISSDAKVSLVARSATLKALDAILQEKYSVSLSDIPIEIDKTKLPSFGEVKAIEGIAQKKFKESQNELSQRSE